MRNLFLIPIISVLFIAPLQAQRIQEKGIGIINLERHQFTVNLLGPGFRYEIGIIRNVTASTSFTPAFATYQEGYTFGYSWHLRLRYYHNFNQRLDINKNVVGNSANYIAAARSIFFEPLQLIDNMPDTGDWAFAFYGGVYGIQRTNRKGFNINAEVGYGYMRGDGLLNGHGPMVHITFGWVATKRKKKNSNFQIKN
ncbi:hypothetical protein [Croceivirga thetidis]|uniref:DUF3575 domain-containing protein n=1 Tax=Croceivirga thetidis TaxID=2721623 RepID=A0ABX1GVX2_9FLAO|nr:hypothetical protein [Croceivirga thetidis]NKI33130.1 hypothetical protein [Croceivirga thetidis]